MSYDISLVDPVTHEQLYTDVPHDMRGGTYAQGGTTELWLNITYNYGRYYRVGFKPNPQTDEKGIRAIYGLTGAESIPVIQEAITKIQSDDVPDITSEEMKELAEQGVDGYWMPTKANSLKPLYQLIAMAQIRPDGVWDGD